MCFIFGEAQPFGVAGAGAVSFSLLPEGSQRCNRAEGYQFSEIEKLKHLFESLFFRGCCFCFFTCILLYFTTLPIKTIR